MNQEIANYFMERFRDMEHEGFSLAKRIPSTDVRRKLLAYEALSPSDRALFVEAVGLQAASWWAGEFVAPHADTPPSKVFLRVLQNLPYPRELAQLPKTAARAPELRKAAKVIFGQFFSAKPAKDPLEPGQWWYSGTVQGHEVRVYINYAGRLRVRHSLSVDGKFNPESFCFERLYGLGIGSWDLIESGESERAFQIMTETILETIKDFSKVEKLPNNAS